MDHVIPTHQGRAAEKILFTLMGGEGKTVLSNTLFDTTRANNIEFSGAKGVDLLCSEGEEIETILPFKGNMNTVKLQEYIDLNGASGISMVIITITNNSNGGQPRYGQYKKMSLRFVGSMAYLCLSMRADSLKMPIL